jgi:ubiquinone/menaquinone biosynthesis C-methylase UbiE
MNSWNDYALQWEADKSWVGVEDRRVLATNKLGYLERLGHEWGTTESVDQIVNEFILPYIGTKEVIVEIGSGGGRIAHRVAPHVSHLVCIDVERDMLRLCRAALSNAANVTCLLISKSSCIPLISDSVDLVYSFDTMVHLDERTIFRYMQETRRVVRRGGMLMLHVATHETAKGWEHFEDSVARGVSRGQFGSFEYLDSNAVIRMAEHAGFAVVKRSVEGDGNFYYERDGLFVLQRR